MRNFITILVLLFTLSGFTQEFNINKYKYVIVDSQFDFAKEPDQYRLSSLTKYLFNKIGMKAYLDTDPYPEELSKNPCGALFASAQKKPGLLTLKTIIEIKDCFGRTLYTSEVGKSKTKEFERGYYQTVNRSFKSIEALNYSYDESLATKETVAKNTSTKKATVETAIKKEPKVVKKTPSPKKVSKENVLLAITNKNGFELKNDNKTVFVLLKTNQENMYIIKDKNGVFTKQGNTWLAQYYKGGTLISEKYQINF